MSGVVIQSGIVLPSAGTNDFNANSPVIGYENRVEAGNVTATTEDPDHPVTNLANVSTALKWKSGAGSPSSDEYITVVLDTPENVDYMGIAAHNFGSSGSIVSVEGQSEDGGAWVELITEQMLPNDGPVLFRFTEQSLFAIRLRIQENANGITPFLAVMFVGKLLLLQRRIYVGHTPITYGRKLTVVNHRSISGAFLGRIVTGETRQTTVGMRNLTPDWYREYMDPFLVHAKENPFFFAWRPGDYPLEVGFAWLTDDATPQNQLSNGMMQLDMSLEGVA